MCVILLLSDNSFGNMYGELVLLDSAVDLLYCVSAIGSVNDSEKYDKDKERMLRDQDVGHDIEDCLML